VEPLRLFDYCQPIDAGATILVSALPGPRPERDVKLAGAGFFHTRAQADASEYEGVKAGQAINDAIHAAGAELRDIDVAEIYDAFAIAVVEQLEEVGVCGPGEGPAFIASGATALGGSFPTNTGGGQMSWGYMQGHTPLIEAVRQLRGDASPTNVEGAKLALVTTPGGAYGGRAYVATVFAGPRA
jgi:acetyl-CoA acetyltransferase